MAEQPTDQTPEKDPTEAEQVVSLQETPADADAEVEAHSVGGVSSVSTVNGNGSSCIVSS
jgi:hypothetical protein